MAFTTALTQKGQVTIPVAIRKLLDLGPADRLVFSIDEERIVATPVKDDILSLYGSVKAKGKKPVDLKKVCQKMIKQVARQVAVEGS